jgi:hypothetical protein
MFGRNEANEREVKGSLVERNHERENALHFPCNALHFRCLAGKLKVNC